jgi:hypothetical protein
VDCGGVVICTGREVGAFAFTWDVNQLRYQQATSGGGIWGPWPGCDEIPWKDAAPGDIAMGSHHEHQNLPWHIGIIGEHDGELTFIHYARRYGCVVEESLARCMLGRTAKAHRFRFPPEGATDDISQPEEG